VHVETLEEALEPFREDGLLDEVISIIKSGKEAIVYCCSAGYKLDAELVAAKVYKPRAFRSFRNDAAYREGRVILNRRDARAVARRSEHGRDVSSALWTNHEWEVLHQLHAAGADVPKPLARSSSAVLLEFIGSAESAAPLLKECSLSVPEAEAAFTRILDNVQLWLQSYVIHGDLSPYNVLYWADQPVVIDFPQAVDPRFNLNAYSLLQRDMDNIGRYFTRYGIPNESSALTEQLWAAYERPMR
jgi:RIO kinase 1